MKLISRYIYYILIILFLSCEEDIIFNNPLDDDNNPDFIEPETIIIEELDGTILSENAVTITWEGNDLAVEYSYNFNNQGWGEWSDITSVTLSYLDEGFHNFNVKSRYVTGIEDVTPAQITFEVDAVQGPGLRVFPLYKTISSGTESVSLYLEEVNSVSFGNIIIDVISSNCNSINLTSIDEGDLFSGTNVFIHEQNQNQHIINFGLTGGEGLSGTGEIAKIHFNNNGTGCSNQIQLIIDVDNSELRDYSNNEINILDSSNGVVSE